MPTCPTSTASWTPSTARWPTDKERTLLTFNLPDPGEGLAEAEIVHWLIAAGQTVAVNDPLVEIETAKSLVELPSPCAGTVVALLVAEGEVVPVGSPIVTIDDGSGTAAPVLSGPVVTDADAEPAASGAMLVGYGTTTAAVTRRPRAGRALVGIDRDEQVNESYSTGQPVSRPVGEVSSPGALGGQAVPPPLPDPGELAPAESVGGAGRAKPQVRRLARDLGVDLATVVGTGSSGTVTAADVARAAAGVNGAAGGNGAGQVGAVQRIPLRGVRREMVASMMNSVKTPQASLWSDVDVTETVRLIDALKKRREFDGLRISPILILARAVCLAMGRSPEVNGSIDVDAGVIVVPEDVNLGIAAATARGLVVPNIKAANRLSLVALATALNGLVDAARGGRITPSDCRGGTFTITNVGVFGIEGGTPILVPGESAVLCLGAINKRPCVVPGPNGDEIEIRSMATLTLTIDHRVLDGEAGARFLNDVATVLREPGLSLLF